MVKLVTTSVVRGSHQGDSHGGVYLVDLDKQEVVQSIDWNREDIDWQGRGWDRGLRGIAFDGERVRSSSQLGRLVRLQHDSDGLPVGERGRASASCFWWWWWRRRQATAGCSTTGQPFASFGTD